MVCVLSSVACELLEEIPYCPLWVGVRAYRSAGLVFIDLDGFIRRTRTYFERWVCSRTVSILESVRGVLEFI